MACPGNRPGCNGTVYSPISKSRIACGHPASTPPPKKK